MEPRRVHLGIAAANASPAATYKAFMKWYNPPPPPPPPKTPLHALVRAVKRFLKNNKQMKAIGRKLNMRANHHNAAPAITA